MTEPRSSVIAATDAHGRPAVRRASSWKTAFRLQGHRREWASIPDLIRALLAEPERRSLWPLRITRHDPDSSGEASAASVSASEIFGPNGRHVAAELDAIHETPRAALIAAARSIPDVIVTHRLIVRCAADAGRTEYLELARHLARSATGLHERGLDVHIESLVVADIAPDLAADIPWKVVTPRPRRGRIRRTEGRARPPSEDRSASVTTPQWPENLITALNAAGLDCTLAAEQVLHAASPIADPSQRASLAAWIAEASDLRRAEEGADRADSTEEQILACDVSTALASCRGLSRIAG